MPFCKIVLSAKIRAAGLTGKSVTFGEHLRKARLKRGLEQKELAGILRVTESTVWNWENGRSVPPAHACREVTEFLGPDPFPAPRG